MGSVLGPLASGACPVMVLSGPSLGILIPSFCSPPGLPLLWGSAELHPRVPCSTLMGSPLKVAYSVPCGSS